jgi:hypothetical protein
VETTPLVTAALPSEVIALVHHVELNQAGWWDKAVEQLVTAVIWLANRPLSIDALVDDLNRQLAVSLTIQTLEPRVTTLCSSGVLICQSDSTFKISEHSLRLFEQKLTESEVREGHAKGRFLELIKEACPSLPPEITWNDFNILLLDPMIKEIGARTYELLSS